MEDKPVTGFGYRIVKAVSDEVPTVPEIAV